jgi:class 3 adenylate cyclase
VFVGDILNTAARFEEYAKHSGSDLIASRALVDQITLPPGVDAKPCGDIVIRGKEAHVFAYSLTARTGNW